MYAHTCVRTRSGRDQTVSGWQGRGTLPTVGRTGAGPVFASTPFGRSHHFSLGGRSGKDSRGSPVVTKTRLRPPFSLSRFLVAELPLMILPQVHLRKPCYDFYFL